MWEMTEGTEVTREDTAEKNSSEQVVNVKRPYKTKGTKFVSM